MVGHMVSVGEETGQLEQMLTKIADFYEAEVDAKVKALTSLIEPLMIVFVGGMVGFIVISMYLPLFSLVRQDPLAASGHQAALLRSGGESRRDLCWAAACGRDLMAKPYRLSPGRAKPRPVARRRRAACWTQPLDASSMPFP